jgi:oxygen-independent coproporphyrinogen-3 oxidase
MEHLSQLRRLGLFDAKVPRYTSYPPATKFSNDVTGDVFRSWVQTDPRGVRDLGLCACAVLPATVLVLRLPHAGNPVRRAGHRLCGNAQAGGREPQGDPARGVRIEATLGRWHADPASAGPDARLADTITEAMPLADDAEFSVEIDPNEIDDARLTALARSA